MTQSRTSPKRDVECNWLTWGKLVTGSAADSDIVAGFEHAVTRRSAGFPEDLLRFCTLPRLFGTAISASVAIHPDAARTGAVVYRPVICESGSYAVFALVQSLRETPTPGGRNHDQLSVLAVEVAEWCPELIPALVEALAEGPYGRRDLATDTGRLDCARPRIPVPALSLALDIHAAPEDGSGLPGLAFLAPSLREGARAVAHLLGADGNAGLVRAGLPWALGTSNVVKGPGSGFALRGVPARAPDRVHDTVPVGLDTAASLSDWVSFASLIGPDDEPCWAEAQLAQSQWLVRPAARKALAEIATDFLLPVPHQYIGFAEYTMAYWICGKETLGRWPDDPEVFEALYHTVPFENYCAEVGALLNESLTEFEKAGSGKEELSNWPFLAEVQKIGERLHAINEVDARLTVKNAASNPK
jgi:hypothetical protein